VTRRSALSAPRRSEPYGVAGQTVGGGVFGAPTNRSTVSMRAGYGALPAWAHHVAPLPRVSRSPTEPCEGSSSVYVQPAPRPPSLMRSFVTETLCTGAPASVALKRKPCAFVNAPSETQPDGGSVTVTVSPVPVVL